MLVQIVAPISLDKVLKLDDAKSFLKVIGNNDDANIQELIKSAIKEAEDITNRQFADATYELYLPCIHSHEIKLPKNPIISVDKIEIMDLDGVYQEVDSSTYYLYEKHEVGIIYFETIPSLGKTHKKAVKITFKCGYGDNFPEDLRNWLNVRVSTLNEYKEELVIGTIVAKTNHVNNVLDRYKIRSL